MFENCLSLLENSLLTTLTLMSCNDIFKIFKTCPRISKEIDKILNVTNWGNNILIEWKVDDYFSDCDSYLLVLLQKYNNVPKLNYMWVWVAQDTSIEKFVNIVSQVPSKYLPIYDRAAGLVLSNPNNRNNRIVLSLLPKIDQTPSFRMCLFSLITPNLLVQVVTIINPNDEELEICLKRCPVNHIFMILVYSLMTRTVPNYLIYKSIKHINIKEALIIYAMTNSSDTPIIQRIVSKLIRTRIYCKQESAVNSLFKYYPTVLSNTLEKLSPYDFLIFTQNYGCYLTNKNWNRLFERCITKHFAQLIRIAQSGIIIDYKIRDTILRRAHPRKIQALEFLIDLIHKC